MNQTNNKIREEWKDNLNTALEIFKVAPDAVEIFKVAPDAVSKKQITMLVESIIDELLKSQREEMVEKIEKVKEAVRTQTGSFKYDDQYDDCIRIIKDK